MTFAPSYACFGCVEFANNARTKAYVAWACATNRWIGDPAGVVRMSRSWCECDLDSLTNVELVGDPMLLETRRDGSVGDGIRERQILTVPRGATGTFTLSADFGGGPLVTDPISVVDVSDDLLLAEMDEAGWELPTVVEIGGGGSGIFAFEWASSEGDIPLVVLDDDLITYVTVPAVTPIVWTNPIDDEVCWYDPQIPESADFLGIVIEKASGVRSSTFKREMVDAINGGSVLGMPTISGKTIVLEVFIIATSIAGQNYGIQWLERQFQDEGRCPASGSSCSSCQGQLLTIRTHCYDPSLPADEQPVDKGLHTWAAAGTIDGFVPDEERYPVGRGNCEKVLAGVLTIGTEQHDSYSTVSPAEPVTFDATGNFTALGNCLIASDLVPNTDPRCPVCFETACDPCRDDPGCDCQMPVILIEPEQSYQVSACFTNPVCRCIGAAQITDIPAGYETALRISLFAGFNPDDPVFQRFGMRNGVIRVWERPEIEEVENGIVMPTTLEEYEALAARLTPCAEIGVSWIPAGAELVIDGLSGRSWLKCEGRCVDHSARVHTISGTVFPLKARCTDLIFTMEWDCLNVQSEDGEGQIPSSVSIETFLGFKL